MQEPNAGALHTTSGREGPPMGTSLLSNQGLAHQTTGNTKNHQQHSLHKVIPYIVPFNKVYWIVLLDLLLSAKLGRLGLPSLEYLHYYARK